MNQGTLPRVVDCLAATTRYPNQLLTPDADLENDLGIDSVKLVELVIALSEEFGIDLENEQRDPSIRTIGHLANWVDSMLNGHGGGENDAAVADPPPPNGNSRHQFHPAHDSVPASFSRPSYSKPAPTEPEPNGRPQPLDGRVALVTGSGRGVGRTIARVLADRGATVIVNSFHSRDQGEQTAAEINAQGGSAVHLWGSVANPDHVNRMFAEIETRFGLDILVCNASDGRIGSFLELTPDDWERAFQTNVVGHHQCAVRAAAIMQSRGGGSIVTMSAVGAHEYIDGLGSQGVVKAAVESMTRYLACALGGLGIRVNCVAGGPVYGDLLSQFPEAQATQRFWEAMVPDGELCNAMELAHTIAFLVSDDAHGVNGAVWLVDHGFSANSDGRPIHRVAHQTVQVSVG